MAFDNRLHAIILNTDFDMCLMHPKHFTHTQSSDVVRYVTTITLKHVIRSDFYLPSKILLKFFYQNF